MHLRYGDNFLAVSDTQNPIKKYKLSRMVDCIALSLYNIGICRECLDKGVASLEAYKECLWFCQKYMAEDDELHGLAKSAYNAAYEIYSVNLEQKQKRLAQMKALEIELMQRFEDIDKEPDVLNLLISMHPELVKEKSLIEWDEKPM